jgi:hypothetical protein
MPALAVIAVATAYAVREASAGGAHSAVLMVGSRTAAAFLDCQAKVRSDVGGDPALIVVSGGELAGFAVLKDSQLHASRSSGGVDIVGLSIGPPDLGRLTGEVAGGSGAWVALPLFDRYPLGLVVAQDAAPALEAVAAPCVDVFPGSADITRCLRPRSVRALLLAEHEARQHGPARQFLMVPDSAGGTWEALDRLIWPKGVDATSEWIEPDARFRIDLDDVTVRPHAIAFGLPPTSAACAPPFGVRELGLCDADGDDGSPCAPARVSLYAYTREPSECAPGKPCKLHDSLCGVLRTIYTRLGDAKGQAWASTCDLGDRSSRGLLRPF